MPDSAPVRGGRGGAGGPPPGVGKLNVGGLVGRGGIESVSGLGGGGTERSERVSRHARAINQAAPYTAR